MIYKEIKNINLKLKATNMLMLDGRKETCEKILLNSAKFVQKVTNKEFIELFKLGLFYSTPVFKMNEQVLKQGKRKVTKNTPTFIWNGSCRTNLALKFVRNAAKENKNSSSFHKKLAKEILALSKSAGLALATKTEMQKKIFVNKKYLSKFRW